MDLVILGACGLSLEGGWDANVSKLKALKGQAASYPACATLPAAGTCVLRSLRARAPETSLCHLASGWIRSNYRNPLILAAGFRSWGGLRASAAARAASPPRASFGLVFQGPGELGLWPGFSCPSVIFGPPKPPCVS